MNRSQDWKLVLGPGTTADRLLPWLESARGALELQRLDDLDDLWSLPPGGGRLVLGAKDLGTEDVGLVASFLRRHPDVALVLLGNERPRAALRRLAGSDRVRWVFWPPDIVDLEELLTAPQAEPALAVGAASAAAPTADSGLHRATTEAPGHAPTRHAERPEEPRRPERAAPAGDSPLAAGATGELSATDPSAKAEVAELRAIENILAGQGPLPQTVAPPQAPLTGEPTSGGPGRSEPAAYFRDQVADLADLAQELELSFALLRQGLGEEQQESVPVDRLGRTLARLNQFTRTLSYVAAPAPQGRQRIDLGQLLEDHLRLTELGTPAEEAQPTPRLQRRGPVPVVSDKGLLLQALDALLFLARHCAAEAEPSKGGAEGTDGVSIDVRAEGAHADARIEFPAGALEGFALARVTEPYALRRRVPGLGPNALRAAQGILQGQGGDLVLEALAGGDLRFIVRLPLETAPPAS